MIERKTLRACRPSEQGEWERDHSGPLETEEQKSARILAQRNAALMARGYPPVCVAHEIRGPRPKHEAGASDGRWHRMREARRSWACKNSRHCDCSRRTCKCSCHLVVTISQKAAE